MLEHLQRFTPFPILLSVTFDSFCPRGCCWSNAGIIPDNFAIKASAFETNCGEGKFWGKLSLPCLLAESFPQFSHCA